MEIRTLGTSHGATEKGRACSGTLLTIGKTNYLLDCGGNVEAKMTDLELSIRDIRAVFISHMHEDHAGNLSAIVKRFMLYNRDDSHVWVHMPDKEATEVFKNWLRVLHVPLSEEHVSFRIYEEGKIYEDENIRVYAIPTEHIADPSFSFVIETENEKILYTGDLAGDFRDYPKILFEEEFDAVVCELVHFDPEKNIDLLKKTKTKQLIFTHVNLKKAARMDEMKNTFPFPVYVAADGDVFRTN